MMPVGLYVHVPFCHTRCHFCAFYLQIHRDDRADAYMASLEREIRLHAGNATLGGCALASVYFGGGTPTALTPQQLDRILGLVRQAFGIADGAEITVEAHPDTVTADGLARLVEAGFTRISYGAQSMEDRDLVQIGRRATTVGRTLQAVEAAKTAGFRDLNLDLLYGLPGQTIESWHACLDDALRLNPDHLSCYALTVEEHSHLHLDVKRGNRAEPAPELQIEMERTAADRLAEAGFERYEISNYCRPGHACRHNLLYWQGRDYLGLGPSAQSYLDGVRFGNVDDLGAYHRILREGRLPATGRERLTLEQRRREAVIFGLRLTAGVDRRLIGDRDRDGQWHRALDQLTGQGLIEEHGERIRLTEEGRRLADSVAAALL